jgi:membrane protein implicated in regulation of membrane protease activity
MLLRTSRERHGHDPFLPHKMFIIMIGGAIGLAGMAFEVSWLVYVAIGVLAIAVVLSWVQKRRSDAVDDSGGE